MKPNCQNQYLSHPLSALLVGKNYAAMVLLVNILGAAIGTQQGFAAVLSLTGTSAITQNFDTLPTTGTALAQTGGIFDNGWIFLESSTNANTTYDSGTGSNNGGNTYDFGVAGTNLVTDRALGILQSGSLSSTLGFQFTNNTGATINSLTIGYAGEVWRRATALDSLAFSYLIGSTVPALNASGYTTVSGLAFTTPVTGTAAALDGNATANRTVISPVTLSSLTILNGQSVTFRWIDGSAGSSAGMAIDDFSMSFTTLAASSTYYFIGSNTTLGGSGTWDAATTASWSASDTTIVAVAWDSSKKAVFGGSETPQNVTVSGSVDSSAGIDFTSDGYALSGGTLNLTGADAITNSVSVSAASSSTIGSTVTASNGFTKTGSGTLILTGAVTSPASTITAGVLQIGSGGTTGSLSGAVTNNATLAFNRSDSYTFSGAISGTGGVSQIGGGTTILTGSNSYGTTSISSGTLQIGNGGTAGTLGSGAVTNNATLAFNRSDTNTVLNAISGTGAVVQSGAGTTILTGANSYGTTTVSSGTLQIGNGGTIGTLGLGAVTNNATLAFNRSDSSTISNAISGTGAVIQSGAGTTILTGANSYGSTTVSAGTLQIGNGGSSGSLGSGAVTNNATLTFNRSDAVSITIAIGGTGLLNQSGSGATTLSGTNTYSGGTTVTSGSLIADSAAALGSGAVTIKGGSLLANGGVSVPNNIIANAVTSSAFTALYNMTDLVATTTGSGFTASSLSRGNYNGIPTSTDTLPSTTSPSGGSAGGNAPINALGGTLNTATSAYFEFTLDATTASSISLTDLAFLSRSTSSGPLAYTLRSSLDSFVSDIATGTLLANSAYASKANTGLSVSGDPVTFRIYGSGGSAAVSAIANAANWRIDDLALSGTTSTAGVATLGSTSTTGASTFSGGVTLQSDAQLTSAVGGTVTFSGVISDGTSGSKGISKIGTGTVVLTGSNTYSGVTDVKAGKLVVTESIGSSATTVSGSGAILATDTAATIGSSLAISNGAILAVGDAANTTTATATVVGTTTFNNGSIFSWDIDAAGTNYDKLVSSGLVDGDAAGGAVFRIVASDQLVSNSFWNTTKTWTDIFTTNGASAISGWASIFTVVSVVDSSFATITPVGGSFSVSGSTLTWTAVPEPTSALAGLLITAGLLRRRRAA